MPAFDKPLSLLKEYQGTNPKPDDFDAYWDRGIGQMHALGTGYEAYPADFQAPGVVCEDLYFIGVGGARIHAKLVRPENKTGCPAILMYHGLSGSAGDWSDKLRYALAGFVVAALDVRGQGGLSEDVGGIKGNTLRGHIMRGLDDPDPDKLFFRNAFLDTAQLARIVMDMPQVDASRVGATGGSQGGGLTLAAAALEPRIAKIAPFVPYLCDYKRVWDMDLDVDAYFDLREYFRKFDPRHMREKEVFTKLGYVDTQHLAPRIRAEVLFFTGLMDQICPPSTQFAVYNKITSQKYMQIYPDYGHENLPGSQDDAYTFFLSL
ncbi:MAG TPA: alpha/beta fold hydrolase [Clostridia bacterium]|nr:alpha/beta fold hydrolase [Clostridia bacterium]